MRRYTFFIAGLAALIIAAACHNSFGDQASKSASAPASAFDALGLDNVAAIKAIYYAKGRPGGATGQVLIKDAAICAQVEKILRNMPAKTDVGKDFDASMESWDVVITGKNGKRANLEFISTAMWAPDGGWISDKETSAALVAILRKALAAKAAATSASAPSSQPAAEAKARIWSDTLLRGVLPEGFESVVQNHRDPKSGICSLTINRWILQQKLKLAGREFRFLDLWKYDPADEKWLKQEQPDARTMTIRFDSIPKMHTTRTDPIFVELTDQAGLYWARWLEDGKLVQQPIFCGPVMPNDLHIPAAPEGMVITAIPSETSAEVAYIPDPRIFFAANPPASAPAAPSPAQSAARSATATSAERTVDKSNEIVQVYVGKTTDEGTELVFHLKSMVFLSNQHLYSCVMVNKTMVMIKEYNTEDSYVRGFMKLDNDAEIVAYAGAVKSAMSVKNPHEPAAELWQAFVDSPYKPFKAKLSELPKWYVINPIKESTKTATSTSQPASQKAQALSEQQARALAGKLATDAFAKGNFKKANGEPVGNFVFTPESFNDVKLVPGRWSLKLVAPKGPEAVVEFDQDGASPKVSVTYAWD